MAPALSSIWGAGENTIMTIKTSGYKFVCSTCGEPAMDTARGMSDLCVGCSEFMKHSRNLLRDYSWALRRFRCDPSEANHERVIAALEAWERSR